MSSAGSIDNEELRDLYRELILDHARNPRHFGKLDAATHSAEGINPLCGDKLRLYLRVNDDQVIADAGFEGSGCAISVASASLLTDLVAGVDIKKAVEYVDIVTERLTGTVEDDGQDQRLDKLRALEGVRDYPARVKCATLAWHALRSAINENKAAATTE